jgi:hypothetical protein
VSVGVPVTVTDSEKFTCTLTVSPALYEPLAVDDDTPDTVGAVESVHTAYNVVFAEIANVEAAAREVPPHADPAAGCVVHHPAKL